MVAPRPAFAPFETRRGQVDRVEQLAGGLFKVGFFIRFAGAGQTSVDVNFPVAFIEHPLCGGSVLELDPGSPLDTSNFPWGAVSVQGWKMDGTTYRGATLLLVIGGSGTQTGVMHCSAEGKALQAPLPSRAL